MPSGYNPEQLDDALNAVAECIVAGEDVSDLVGQTSFRAADVGSTPEVTWQPPTAGVLELDVLSDAVDRSAETLGSLRGFIDNEIVAMKLAVERQAQETAKRCEQLLHDASTEAAALTESVNTE